MLSSCLLSLLRRRRTGAAVVARVLPFHLLIQTHCSDPPNRSKGTNTITRLLIDSSFDRDSSNRSERGGGRVRKIMMLQMMMRKTRRNRKTHIRPRFLLIVSKLRTFRSNLLDQPTQHLDQIFKYLQRRIRLLSRRAPICKFGMVGWLAEKPKCR